MILLICFILLLGLSLSLYLIKWGITIEIQVKAAEKLESVEDINLPDIPELKLIQMLIRVTNCLSSVVALSGIVLIVLGIFVLLLMLVVVASYLLLFDSELTSLLVVGGLLCQ